MNPSTVKPQSANSACLAYSRKTARHCCARCARQDSTRTHAPKLFAVPVFLVGIRMWQGRHSAKSARQVDIKLSYNKPQNVSCARKGNTQKNNMKPADNAFHVVLENGAISKEHTMTHFAETALLVSTHQLLACQKNPIALIARKGDLVNKVGTLQQLVDARIA